MAAADIRAPMMTTTTTMLLLLLQVVATAGRDHLLPPQHRAGSLPSHILGFGQEFVSFPFVFVFDRPTCT